MEKRKIKTVEEILDAALSEDDDEDVEDFERL